MADDREFSAGYANMQPRDEVPFTEDPRAMFRAAAGALGGYGMGQAGLGMLGGAVRGYNSLPSVERMFSPTGVGAGMLSALGIGSAAAGELQPQRRVNPALEKYGPQEMDQSIKIGVGPYGGRDSDHFDWNDITTFSDERLARAQNHPNPKVREMAVEEIQRRMQARGEELQRMRGGQKRSDMGMLEQIARAPAPRPSGAGDRRDKRLREAEDRDVKTS